MPSVRARHAIACAFVTVLSCPLAAQVRQTVGPARCVDCHDHRDEKEWWQTKDGDGKGKQHSKADRRLEDAKAPQYAKALGLADVYDPNGACVTCHATVVAGSADFGVSCESCHGPGRDYLTPHQTKGTYASAIKLGHDGYEEQARGLGAHLPRVSRDERAPGNGRADQGGSCHRIRFRSRAQVSGGGAALFREVSAGANRRGRGGVSSRDADR